MTLAAEHSDRTLEAIVSKLALDEVVGDGSSGHRLDLVSEAFGPVGSMRVFTGDGVSKVVYIGMTVAPIGLDVSSARSWLFGRSDAVRWLPVATRKPLVPMFRPVKKLPGTSPRAFPRRWTPFMVRRR